MKTRILPLMGLLVSVMGCSDDENIAISTEYKPVEAVDLGLSVRWATKNVGAASPTSLGDYFAWGATQPLYKSYTKKELTLSFDWKEDKENGYLDINAPYYDSDLNSYTKYGLNEKIRLVEEDDAACQWEEEGGSYRMPTDGEFEELMNECYWEYTSGSNETYSGIPGFIIYKSYNRLFDHFTTKNSDHEYSTKKDNHIFLPLAGYIGGIYGHEIGIVGCYWSASLYGDTGKKTYATDMRITRDSAKLQASLRHFGEPIRGVTSSLR